MEDIKKQIVSGALAPGDKLLSTRELANAYTINPNTAMRVYSELEAEGISFTRRGLGTFVSEDSALIEKLRHEMAEMFIENFLDEIKAIGCTKEEILDAINNKY